MANVKRFRRDDAPTVLVEHDVFVLGCRVNNVPAPEREYVFAPGRKFAFDYAWPNLRVALEREGGVFTRQAHGSVSGILRDIEKYNLAASLGWRVLRVIPANIAKATTYALIRATMESR